MISYSINQSALGAMQFAIDQIANNIANANTPGYHRRQVLLTSRPDLMIGGRPVGTGVQIGTVRGIRDKILENSLSQALGDLSSIRQQASLERQIEPLFSSGAGSLYDRFGSLFGEMAKLSTNPNQASQRNLVINQGAQLANQLRFVGQQLENVKVNSRYQMQQEVTDLNFKLNEVIEIQKQIRLNSSGIPSNELIDQRDRLVNEIAEIIDVNRNEQVQGGFGLVIGGGAIQIGEVPVKFSVTTAPNGDAQLMIGEKGQPIVPRGGRLGALLEVHNNTVNQYKGKLTQLASSIVRNFDQTHAEGVGVSGGFSILTSQRGVTDPTAALSQSGLPFDIAAGDLYITVTGPAGERRTSKVSYDPKTQSLNDLAANISGVDNLQAVVDPQSKQLKLIASPGHKFDFTGRLETVPGLTSFTGTATPKLSGEYLGKTNQNIRVAISGSGTVGVTNGLAAEVFDASGNLLAKVNIGEGYESGKPIELLDGVKLEFGPGTVNTGDEFTTPLVATVDSGKLLSAIGLNSFFQGKDIFDLAVNADLVANPDRLATSKSGEVSDTRNLKRLLELKDLPVVDGKNSFEQFLSGITAEIGSSVRATSNMQIQMEGLMGRFEAERDSYSGVDLNEEMINLTKFQRSYEASVRTLSSIDKMYDDLLGILR